VNNVVSERELTNTIAILQTIHNTMKADANETDNIPPVAWRLRDALADLRDVITNLEDARSAIAASKRSL
jgi:hypothetical protein